MVVVVLQDVCWECFGYNVVEMRCEDLLSFCMVCVWYLRWILDGKVFICQELGGVDYVVDRLKIFLME